MILKFCEFFVRLSAILIVNRGWWGWFLDLLDLSLGFNLGFGKCIWLKRGHVGEQPADGTYTLKMMGG